MTIQHSMIQSAGCHEPKHITDATTADTGMVLTPSSTTNGQSELRYLTLDDILGGDGIADDVFMIVDSADATKILVFQLSGITTGTTRTWTVPDASGVIVLDTLVQTLTGKRITPRPVTLTDAATIAINSDNGDVFNLVLTGDHTLGNPTGTPTDGQRMSIRISQDGSGAHVLTFDTAYLFAGGTPPTISVAANARDVITFEYNLAATKWDAVSVVQDMS